MLPPLNSTSKHGVALLALVVVLAACSSNSRDSTTIVEQNTTCPDYREDAGTRIIWTDSRTEAQIWQAMCGPVASPTTTAVPTTTTAPPTTSAPTTTTSAPPTTNAATTTTVRPTTTTAATTTTTTAPTTTIVEKSTVCPSNRARAGRTVTWIDDRSEEEIWETRCGGVQPTTTTQPWIERQWNTSRYTDTVTNEEVIGASRHKGDAYLFFVCPGSNDLEITIWGEEVPVDSSLDRYRRAEVTYRIGDEVVESASWGMARQDGRYLLSVPENQQRSIINLFRDRSSDVFAFSAALPGMPEDQVIDLAGFEEAVEPVLEACGW